MSSFIIPKGRLHEGEKFHENDIACKPHPKLPKTWAENTQEYWDTNGYPNKVSLWLIPFEFRSEEICIRFVKYEDGAAYIMPFIPKSSMTTRLILEYIDKKCIYQDLALIPKDKFNEEIVAKILEKKNVMYLNIIPERYLTGEMILDLIKRKFDVYTNFARYIPHRFMNMEVCRALFIKDRRTYRYFPIAIKKQLAKEFYDYPPDEKKEISQMNRAEFLKHILNMLEEWEANHS